MTLQCEEIQLISLNPAKPISRVSFKFISSLIFVCNFVTGGLGLLKRQGTDKKSLVIIGCILPLRGKIKTHKLKEEKK